MRLYRIFIPDSEFSAECFKIHAENVEAVFEEYPSADKIVELDPSNEKDMGGIYRTKEGKWKPLFASNWN